MKEEEGWRAQTFFHMSSSHSQLPSASSPQPVQEAIHAVLVGHTQAWQIEKTTSEGTGRYQILGEDRAFCISCTWIMLSTSSVLMGTALPGKVWRTPIVFYHLKCRKSHFQSHLQVQAVYQQHLHTKISCCLHLSHSFSNLLATDE